MHKKISTQISILPSLLILALIAQDAIAAPPTIQKLTPITKSIPATGSGFVAAQGASVNPHVLKVMPTLTLTQTEQSLRRGDSESVGYVIADTNGDGTPDSAISVPKGTPGAMTLTQALKTLRSLGGDGKRYLAIDTNGDSLTDSILAITY